MDAADPFLGPIARLRDRLSAPLPGVAAMAEMSPSDRPFVPASEALAAGASLAAAAVLLYPGPEPGGTWMPLTLRNADLRVHAGQVSLPGGRLDVGESVDTAAVRELSEELGVRAPTVLPVGKLTPVWIAASGFVLQPVVLAVREQPAFHPNPAEVDAVLEVPLVHFVGVTNRRAEARALANRMRHVPYFAVGRQKVWGATAMVLAELARCWSEAMDAGAPG